nr:chloride channel protein [Kineosphaera limosa]
MRYGGLVVVIGVLTGLGAAGLAWVLHLMELVVYGKGEEHGQLLTDGVDPLRMSIAVALVSLLLAPAWWLLRAKAPPLVGVKGMVGGKRPPFWTTIGNAVFQMVGVGAGMPVGREVAPREIGALAGSRVAERTGLDADTRRLLIAAAAGAGLGAVYQVPLGGAVFAMELLLGRISVTIALTCLGMSVIAVLVARVVISPVHQFAAPALDGSDWRIIVWAITIGLLLGVFGGWFGDLADHVKKHSQRGRLTLLTLPAAGLGVAVMAFWLPLVLGNGRAAMQSALLGMGLGLAALTLVGKCLATFLTLRAGAVGGTLAPAFAVGALAGVIIGRLAELAVPGLDVPVTGLAVMGAAAVLATSLRAPITGLLMIAGITSQPHEAYAVLAITVGAAYATCQIRPKLPHIAKG